MFEHTEFYFSSFRQLQRPLALFKEPIVIHILFLKDAYGKSLVFATLGSYVAFLWDIKFIQVSVEDPFWRIFGGGGAETKTGLG